MTLPIGNKVIIFLYRRSRTFFTANGGLFVFAAFQPAIGQARMGVAGNIREHALEISPDTHRRIGQSPEKPQIFLCLLGMVYSWNVETHTNNNAYTKRIPDCHHPHGDGFNIGFGIGNDGFVV